MADRESPLPQPPLVVIHVPPVQPVVSSVPPALLAVPPAQPGPLPQLNCLYFTPEFAGKPDENAEAHLLRINYWIDTQAFQEGVKVHSFCLILVGEPRLWYESHRTIAVNWECLWAQFSQQYSRIGNTREKLFHLWRSFFLMKIQDF